MDMKSTIKLLLHVDIGVRLIYLLGSQCEGYLTNVKKSDFRLCAVLDEH